MMSTKRSVASIVCTICLLGGLLTSCASTATNSAQTITLYNGQHVQTTDSLVTAFTKATGIAVNVRSGDEDLLTDQIVNEGKNSPADVIFTENSPPLQELASKGLLAPVAPSSLLQTPAKFNSPSGLWEGVTARVSVLVYNTNDLKTNQLPTSVMDLANPKWRGKLALAPGETDFQPIVTSVARRYGNAAALKWLDALKANARGHIYPDNETITSEVNSGQAEIGVINQYYWYRERVEIGASNMHSAIATFAPYNAGYVIDISGAGILKSSTHKVAAQKFLAFLTSKQAQEIIAHSDSFEYPIGSGVTTAKHETPFDQLRPDPISVAQLGTGATAVHLLQEAQLL